jgi:hypothetical protein
MNQQQQQGRNQMLRRLTSVKLTATLTAQLQHQQQTGVLHSSSQ